MPVNSRKISPYPESAIIDTSIYIPLLRQRKYERQLLELPLLIRFSSVVIAELLRGAHSKKAMRAVHDLYRGRTLIVPSAKDWVESGELLARLALQKHFDISHLRELHFDVLIALSARSIGAYVITANAGDFREIRRARDFKLIVWPG